MMLLDFNGSSSSAIFLLSVMAFSNIIHGNVVRVTSKSVGCNSTCDQCASYTMVNSDKYLTRQPGLHIIAISNETGRVMHNSSFDYLSLKREKLKTFLTDIPASFIVVITVHQQCLAKISGWYELLREHSDLKLHPYINETAAVNNLSIITTCQNDCPLGLYSPQDFPLYQFTLQGYTPVHSIVSIRLGINSVSKSDSKDIIDETMLIIILAVSIAAVLIMISLIITMVFCCKNANTSRQNQRNNQSTTSAATAKIPSRLEKWVQQKQIKDINKEIVKKSLRKDLDTRSYKGDIVRGSVSTSTLSRDFHVTLANDYENVFDGDQQSRIILGRSVSSSYSVYSLNSAAIDADGYLKPKDFLTTPKTIKIYDRHVSKLINQSYDNSSKSLDVPQAIQNKRNRSPAETATEIVKEQHAPSDYMDASDVSRSSVYSNLQPCSSHQIFLSQPNVYTTPEEISKKPVDETNDNIKQHKFAEYCQVNINGPLYKRPSDVIRYDPPEYIPSEIPKVVPRADSVESTDKNYANLKDDVKKNDPDHTGSQTDTYDELTERFNAQHNDSLYEEISKA